MLKQDKEAVAALIAAAAKRVAPDAEIPAVTLERPKVAAHGDLATNLALQVAKSLKRNPRELAQALVASMTDDPEARQLIDSAEVAGPGFINLRIAAPVWQRVVRAAIAQGATFGSTNDGARQRVVVEFVSANPTGPLHLGHARQAALGDALSGLLASQGWDVTREFYYNDAGNQINSLAASVQARASGIGPDEPGFPPDGYRGEYIAEIAQDFIERGGDPGDLDAVRLHAVACLRKEQDLDLQAFNLKFDCYYLESSLYTDGRVEDTVRRLIASGNTYELDGALWLRTTALGEGDDKDRVMRKSDGGYTYFVPDVAYHVTKWERGFRKAIDVQGGDHHGTVARVRSGLQALGAGIPEGYPDYVLHKMVRVMRGGEEVKISKRAGSYVTMRDLIDWVGRDAVRLFLISRKADTEFVFDVDLALSQRDENPVFYLQYAHARMSSIINAWGGDPAALRDADLAPLATRAAQLLIQRIAEYPEVLAQAVEELAPHHVAFYLKDLAADFHSYYNAERVLVDDEPVRNARLALLFAARQALRNGLALLGVSAPEKMEREPT